MVVDYCTGPFTTASLYEPSSCYGCPTCQDPLPVAEPDEVLHISATEISWSWFEDLD